MRETIPGTHEVAQRIINAENSFIDFAKEFAGLSQEQAENALVVCKHVKAIRIEAGTGQFRFTHGAFVDPDVLRRAANSIHLLPPKKN